jgi:universal stress protein E
MSDVNRPRYFLVATDFSEPAGWALDRARRLAGREESMIEILHVIPGGFDTSLDTRIDEAARAALDRLVLTAEEAWGPRRPALRTIVARGEPFVEILERAKAGRYDVIVVGRHGKRRYMDLLMGSTADRIIRKADKPVLVVGGAPEGPYRRPLAAVDLDDFAAASVALMLRLLPAELKHATLLHAFPSETLDLMREYQLPEAELVRYRALNRSAAEKGFQHLAATLGPGIDWELSFVEGEPREAILRALTTRHVDLLAIGTHGRSGAGRLLLGSVAEAVLRRAACDVLVSHH